MIGAMRYLVLLCVLGCRSPMSPSVAAVTFINEQPSGAIITLGPQHFRLRPAESRCMIVAATSQRLTISSPDTMVALELQLAPRWTVAVRHHAIAITLQAHLSAICQ